MHSFFLGHCYLCLRRPCPRSRPFAADVLFPAHRARSRSLPGSRPACLRRRCGATRCRHRMSYCVPAETEPSFSSCAARILLRRRYDLHRYRHVIASPLRAQSSRHRHLAFARVRPRFRLVPMRQEHHRHGDGPDGGGGRPAPCRLSRSQPCCRGCPQSTQRLRCRLDAHETNSVSHLPRPSLARALPTRLRFLHTPPRSQSRSPRMYSTMRRPPSPRITQLSPQLRSNGNSHLSGRHHCDISPSPHALTYSLVHARTRTSSRVPCLARPRRQQPAHRLVSAQCTPPRSALSAQHTPLKAQQGPTHTTQRTQDTQSFSRLVVRALRQALCLLPAASKAIAKAPQI